MAKLLALDLGGKRTGVAETDPLQMIASPRETVPTADLLPYLKALMAEEEVEGLVLGYPLGLDGKDTDNTERVRKWEANLRRAFPHLKLYREDERFTSVRARQAQLASGMKKSQRRQKGSLDAISAALILEDFLQRPR